MNELTAHKINKWLFWLICASFVILTYMNFKSFFNRLLWALLQLPFWFLLTGAALMGLLLIRWVESSEKALKGLEGKLQREQRELMEMELRFRLVRQELDKISPGGFVHYCSDILRVLRFTEIKPLPEKKGKVDLTAVNRQQEPIYIKCVQGSPETARSQIHQLYYEMLQDGVGQGLVLTDSTFCDETKSWASTFKIQCMNGKSLSRVVEALIEEPDVLRGAPAG